MTNKEYISLAMRTETTLNPLVSPFDPTYTRLLHSALGCGDESGEITKLLKDKLFYDQPFLTIALQEEYGDLLWYIALGIDAIDSSFEEIMEMNIAKLRARYPDKFTEEKAIDRDLDTERKALEDKFGRVWKNPSWDLCPVCGQPDNCGDCNHKKLSETDVVELGGVCPDSSADRKAVEEVHVPDIDLVMNTHMSRGEQIVCELEVYHAIMSGQAKGEIVQSYGKFVMRIRE